MASNRLEESRNVPESGTLPRPAPGSPRYTPPETAVPLSVRRVGQLLGRTRKGIDNTQRYYSKKLPVREGQIDLLGSAYNFKFVFTTYSDNNTAYLDLVFYEDFDESIGVPWQQAKAGSQTK